jgi:hypothetical protein
MGRVEWQATYGTLYGTWCSQGPNRKPGMRRKTEKERSAKYRSTLTKTKLKWDNAVRVALRREGCGRPEVEVTRFMKPLGMHRGWRIFSAARKRIVATNRCT